MRRPPDPLFDNCCRMEKRNVRHLEREVRRANVAVVIAALTVRRREYRDLLRWKWKAKIDTVRLIPSTR
jgi:hypothetical protein